MAGQFDKYVKILGNGSRPDRYVGAPGNPDMVVSREVSTPENTETNTNSSLVANAPKQVAADKESKQAADVAMNRNYYGKGTRKRQIAGLKTTTMRLDEKTGEAYDTGDIKPTPSGRVMPTRQANPKYLAADVQRQNEDVQSFTAAESKRNVGDQDSTGEAAFSNAEEAKGSTLRSLNGVTYDTKDYDNYLNDLPANGISRAIKPYDISEFEPKTNSVEQLKTSTNIMPSGYKPSKSAGDLEAEKTDSMLTQGARLAEKKEKEADAPRKPKRTPGGTPKYTGPSQVIGSEAITAPDMDVVETKISDSAHDLRADMSEGKDPDITSTTMREVPSGRPDKVLGHVPVRSPRELAGYEKPKVNSPGNVIPQMAIDTFGSQPTDREQAEAENKRLRENRGTPATTTVFDPNVRAARPSRGQTPERAAVLGAIREKRSAALASEGKDMTTVHPEVMGTAKRLGRTSMYNLDNDYMGSTSFLAHEAVQKATVAHALGVHHTLGTDDDHLHAYLGGKPLEAKSRLAAAYKIVDRNLRGNPEKTPGEFALLRGMVHAGSSPQQTLRAVRGGTSNDVVVNGQSVTIAKNSSENRQKIADNTTNITAQAEEAPKIARGSMAGTPTAPLAGTNRVAVRQKDQKPEEATIRDFTPQEARNRRNIPGVDDSKGPRVVDLGGLKPGEKNTNKILKEEKDS